MGLDLDRVCDQPGSPTTKRLHVAGGTAFSAAPPRWAVTRYEMPRRNSLCVPFLKDSGASLGIGTLKTNVCRPGQRADVDSITSLSCPVKVRRCGTARKRCLPLYISTPLTQLLQSYPSMASHTPSTSGMVSDTSSVTQPSTSQPLSTTLFCRARDNLLPSDSSGGSRVTEPLSANKRMVSISLVLQSLGPLECCAADGHTAAHLSSFPKVAKSRNISSHSSSLVPVGSAGWRGVCS
mmetsp:Transcript_35645/g.89598  ORF Transcript_35645/g.89598 Transcript_35645/m.89598 type:complete len:237 (-) Transcript_35645:398-1108(-)